MEILKEITSALQKGEPEAVEKLSRQALKDNILPEQILNEGFIPGMDVVGENFRNHEIFLPDVLLAAKAMNAGMEILRPLLIKKDIPSRGKIVIGTVLGDLHDIGKNLVGIMLKGAGFEVIDLGNDVAPASFVKAAKEENSTIIGMSALLTTTMVVMREVIDKIKEENLNIKTIIGGAPVSRDFAEEIGADAYGFDAGYAVNKIKELLM